MIALIRRRLQEFINVSDEELLARVARGDKQAFGRLYMRYMDSIYRYVYFRVNQRREVAEDLVSSTFSKAWENISSFNTGNGTFKAWLYRISHNTVIDHYRTHKTTLPLGKLKDNGVNGEHDSVFSKFLKKARTKELSKALTRLTDAQKQTLVLKYVEGLKSKEIAAIMGKKADAVRALQSRGLKRLKTIMSES